MAYLIVNDEGFLYKIAKNDTDKNNLNCNFPPYKTIDISDTDFLKVKKGLVSIDISNGSATFADLDFSKHNIEENNLKNYHQNILPIFNDFLNNNPSNGFYTECKNYYDYLKTFNYSSISFPLNKTWEQYCEDNLIPYLNPLQVP
jgi:hypothetical protein